MKIQNFKFNLQKATTPNKRPLFIKLLLTALCMCIILTVMAYGIKKLIEPIPKQVLWVETQSEESIPEPQSQELTTILEPKTAVPSPTVSNSLKLIKVRKSPIKKPRIKARSVSSAMAKPRLRKVGLGSSGGNFAKPVYKYQAIRKSRSAKKIYSSARPAEQTDDSDAEIILTPHDLTKKIKLKGSKPVSVEQAKLYTDIDLEAEALREERRMETIETELLRKNLLHEKLWLVALITLLGIAMMLLGSRVIRALRLLKKPEGKHWTLK